jgi:quinol monooxygenase YgiN
MPIAVTATLDLDPATAAQTLRDARPLIEASRAEPGCLTYDWSLDPLSPGRVCVFELWRDADALRHHFTLPNYTEMAARLAAAGLSNAIATKYLIAREAPVYDPQGIPNADFPA